MQTMQKNNGEYSINLQQNLWDRESGFIRRNWRCKSPSWFHLHERQYYRSIRPNFTVGNIEKPDCYIRKFTPDGKYLLCISLDQRNIELYKFNGVGHAGSLLHGIEDEFVSAKDEKFNAVLLRLQLFNKLFTFHKRIKLVQDYLRCSLNREFTIFIGNGQYVLMGGSSLVFDAPHNRFFILYPDANDDTDFFCYNFFLVNLQTFEVSDQYCIPFDSISLSNNNGISVHKSTIAIFSKLRQCVDILQVVNGKLHYLYEIGVHADAISAAEYQLYVDSDTSHPNPLGILSFSHFKQQIIMYMFKNALESAKNAEQLRYKLHKFYQDVAVYDTMLIIKAQLIDSDTLLLRYERRPHPDDEITLAASFFKLYVFYCLLKKRVVKVYKNDSIELMTLMRYFSDNFRNVTSIHTNRHSSSPSNNEYLRHNFDSVVHKIAGGPLTAAHLLNAGLPISTQSYSTSSYFDCDLFMYEERLISQLERPKVCTTEPIPFYDRLTGLLSFRLFLEPPEEGHDEGQELVAFIFHPYEPFALSLQKCGPRVRINFHIYNPLTIVARKL